MDLGRALRALDSGVVVLLAASGLAEIWGVDPTAAGRWEGGPLVHSALLLAATLPLLVRRQHPLPVLGTVAVAGWLQYETGGGLGQPWFALVLAVYAVAAHAGRRDATGGALIVLVLAVADSVPRLRAGDRWDDVVPAWLVLGLVWALGWWVRRRRQDALAVEERALALDERTAALEEERTAAGRAAAAQERGRIARELHDLVAHSMGVIVIQAQAAQRMLATDPAATARSLASIETMGRQGMGEMRRLLDVLTTTEDDAPLSPVPALRHLGGLLDRVRAAGLLVELVVEGRERTLPPGVDLSAYRIVQEALTNTLRHAGATTATVRLRYGSAAVDVEVTDDGTGQAAGARDLAPAGVASGGHGLVGMRQRVALYGGNLHTGARSDSTGWVVRAHLPVEAPSPTTGATTVATTT